MNIFVTGVSGFIGKVFLEDLLALSDQRDSFFVLSRKFYECKDARVKCLVGNLEEIERFEENILNANYVFHLAANPTYGSDIDYDHVNYIPTKKIADMLKASKRLRNLVFISTIGVLDRNRDDRCCLPLTNESIPSPTSLYGESKLKAEEYIKRAGIPFTIIRPTWVYGRDMRATSHINKFVSMVYVNNPVVRLNFPGRVSLIHVDDLSMALCRCINNANVINNTYIAETEDLSIGDIFRIIYKGVYGRDILQVKIPRFSFIFGAIHRKLPLAISNMFLDYLYSKDESFKKDFSLNNPKCLSGNVKDVVLTNIHKSGYWVITGANGGIGSELARKLNKLNKKLILIDKTIDNLNSFKTNHNHIVIKADLASEKNVYDITEKINKRKIFCLINNAGIGYRKSIKEITLEEIQEILDVNVKAPLFLFKLLLENLIKNEGVLVNIASSIAYNPLPNMALYSSSKAFLSNWSESITYELKKIIKIVTVSPSGTYTNFQKISGVKDNKGKGLMTADYVADKIIKAVYGRKRVVVIGKKARILLFVSKLLPRDINIQFWGILFGRLR